MQINCNFYKDLTKKGGFQCQCIKFIKQYHSNNEEKRKLRDRNREKKI